MTAGSWNGCRVVFRCDGSQAIGFGHVSRCLTLAAGCLAQGVRDLQFICRDLAPDVIRRIDAAGHACRTLRADAEETEDIHATLAACRERRSLVITDSHDFSEQYYAALHAAGIPVLSVDDYAGVAYASDVVVNHNITADRFAYRVASHTRLLLGPDFLPLRATFSPWLKKPREIRKTVESIVITLGGMPEPEAVLQVLDGLREWGDDARVRLTVVLGLQADPGLLATVTRALPRSGQVLVAPSDFAGLLWQADIAVVNGSVTAYEAAAIGTPLVMTAVDANQADAVAGFKEKRMAVTLPDARELTPASVMAAVAALAADPDRRRELSAAGRRLVDGKGTERILQAASALLSNEPVGSERGTCGQ